MPHTAVCGTGLYCRICLLEVLTVKAKRLLAIHDLCSFGRCSLTAVIPVLSAMGVQVCPFPTAVFSNNLTYGNADFYNFSPHMEKFMEIWKKNGYQYDAIYSGFLADDEQIGIVRDAISFFARKEDTLVVVDPAMGDDGKLYAVFKPAIVAAMRQLIAGATVITPNFTELCLLLDIPCTGQIPSVADLNAWCRKLVRMGPEKVVITSVPAPGNQIKNVSYDNASNSYNECSTQRIPLSTCGTGDLFTSVLTGCLLKGFPLALATEKAMTFMSSVIGSTYEARTDPREGVIVEPCLKELMNIVES